MVQLELNWFDEVERGPVRRLARLAEARGWIDEGEQKKGRQEEEEEEAAAAAAAAAQQRKVD